MALQQKIFHVATLCLMSIIIFILLAGSGTLNPSMFNNIDPWTKYGKWQTIAMYIMRYLTLLPLPLVLVNFLGIVMYDTFPGKPKLKTSTLFGPLICFRVVTRGTFPELVKRNVKRNIELCSDIGLDNFVFEIATDQAINLTKGARIREVVVPEKYRTRNGSLYKARALQYCLEEGVNVLSDNEWVVHLDEETILTESCVIGIINFINEGKHTFGQGVITYANEEIVCWITTIADLVRVGVDYGMLRFCLNYLHRPIFNWKGSFMVCNAGAEKKISFDFGVEGSTAEDCFFALSAWKEGYSFGFIEGEMWEKSTFSVMDYIRQRKRWVQGIIMTIFSSRIPSRNKLGMTLVVLNWLVMPLTIPNIVLVPLYPLPLPQIVSGLCAFMGGFMTFLFIFGAIKSFNYRRVGIIRFLLLCLAPVVLMPVCILMEASGITWALLSKKQGVGFHIVNKETGKAVLEV